MIEGGDEVPWIKVSSRASAVMWGRALGLTFAGRLLTRKRLMGRWQRETSNCVWCVCVGAIRKREYLTLADAPVSDCSLICHVNI